MGEVMKNQLWSKALLKSYSNLENVAKQMVKMHDELQPAVWKVVFKDNGFSSDSSKTNIKEIFKCAGLEEEAFTTI